MSIKDFRLATEKEHTWTPKVCQIIAQSLLKQPKRPLFYILLGSRYRPAVGFTEMWAGFVGKGPSKSCRIHCQAKASCFFNLVWQRFGSLPAELPHEAHKTQPSGSCPVQAPPSIVQRSPTSMHVHCRGLAQRNIDHVASRCHRHSSSVVPTAPQSAMLSSDISHDELCATSYSVEAA